MAGTSTSSSSNDAFSVTKITHLQGTCVMIVFDLHTSERSLVDFVQSHKSAIIANLSPYYTSHLHKAQLCAKVQFVQMVKVDNIDAMQPIYKEWYVSNKSVPFDSNFLTVGTSALDEKIAVYTRMSSGWLISRIKQMHFVCSEFTHFCGSTA